jgi:hypothetical protein
MRLFGKHPLEWALGLVPEHTVGTYNAASYHPISLTEWKSSVIFGIAVTRSVESCDIRFGG